jgi:hypothetical protein
MTSRERTIAALNHDYGDMIPFDIGSTSVTGMQVSTVYKLRQVLKLDEPGTPVKVIEPYQMLGEIAPDLINLLGIDVIGMWSRKNMFGFENKNWKKWTLFDGTPVLVPGDFNTIPNENGDIFMYPEGDKSLAPSGRMPKGGFYFDAVVRQDPIDENNLCVEDNLEEFSLISDEDLNYFEAEAERLYTQTDKAIVASFGGTAFGDIALVPAMWLRHPKGIRDIQEWYMSTLIRKDYIYSLFEKQCEIALKNLEKIYSVVGNKICVTFLTGTDFGTQCGPFISSDLYRDLYQPFHKEINNWIHKNTGWKTFMHSCGSIYKLIPDFIESGFDILNPVQCSASDMNASRLKKEFGEKITFWGGGVDTQKTLPFGSAGEVRDEVKLRMDTFGPGGGFVFNAIHNIQARVPIENLMAMFETFRDSRNY